MINERLEPEISISPASNILAGSEDLDILATPGNEFNRAKAEWLERYGDYLSQARNWRIVSLCCLVITMLSVSGVVYMGSKNHIVPYVVEINTDGVARAIARADEARPTDSRVIKSMLGRFIINLRSVSLDSQLQRQMVIDAFNLLSSDSPASTSLTGYYAQNDNNPLRRARKELVNIELKSILPTTKDTWAIEWTETTRDRKGKVMDIARMKAMATIAIVPPRDDAAILRNPIGLYVEDFNWAKQID